MRATTARPGSVIPDRGAATEEHREVSVSRPAAVIILAAGEGTRMKSDTPKVLHAICGETLLGHVLAAARETDPVRVIVVVGHRRREVTESRCDVWRN